MGDKLPSPCIGVCKFKRPGVREPHCIACSMTKSQKKVAKSLKKEAHRAAFLDLVRAQQAMMGRYRAWAPAYLRRCMKKGIKPPFRATDAA